MLIWRRITLRKTSNFSFSDCPCCSSIKLFDAVLSIMKTTNFNFSENAYNMTYRFFLNKPENAIEKVQLYRKKGTQSH